MDPASRVKRRSELTSRKKPEKPPGVDKLAGIWFVSALIIVFYDISVILIHLDPMYYGSYLVIFFLDFLFGLVWISTCFGLWMDKSWSYSLAQFIVLMLIIRIFVGIVIPEFHLASLFNLVSIVSYGGLFNSLEDAKNSDHVRQVAAKALREIGDERAVDPLIKALKDGNQEIREIAAEALGQIGDERAVDPLIEALKDGDWDVRRAATEALGKTGNERATEPLIEVRKDNQRDSCRNFGKIEYKRAIKPFIRTFKSRVRYIQRAAKALRKIALKIEKPAPKRKRIPREIRKPQWPELEEAAEIPLFDID